MLAGALFVLLGSVTPLCAQGGTQSTSVQQWLDTSCGVGNAADQPLTLEAFDADAVPLFIEAFEAGPQQESSEQVRGAAQRRFDRVQRLLEGGQSFGLSESDLAVLRQTQREAFVLQAVNDFTFAYADAALRALSVLGGRESREFLVQISQDMTSPHANTASTLLREM